MLKIGNPVVIRKWNKKGCSSPEFLSLERPVLGIGDDDKEDYGRIEVGTGLRAR